jgi:NHL repeat
VAPVGASAAAPEFVLQIPEGTTDPGSGAGELDNTHAVAASPASGHIYISEVENRRVSEYTAWGLFVKAWGWDVAPEGAPGDTPDDSFEVCGPAQPEVDPLATLCQKGDPGEGRGQMSTPVGGMAVDPAGNIWVGDFFGNNRIQKFSPSGQFLLMLGGEVNRTKTDGGAPADEQDVCPIDPTDVCKAGTPGEGPSHLAGSVNDVIAYSPVGGGALVVGDKGRIQIFDLDGTYREEIGFDGPLAAFAGMTVNGLDVDTAGNIYFSLTGEEDVYKLNPAGEPLAPGEPGSSGFDVGKPLGVAVDVQGNVYAIDDPFPGEDRIVIFDPTGNTLTPTSAEEAAGEFFPYIPFQGPSIFAIGTNFCPGSDLPGNLYVAFFEFNKWSYVNAYGSGPVGCEPPPARPPEVTAQFATAVGRDAATIRAQINPRFLTDTTYYVEYGPGKCAEGDCPVKVPLSPPALTDKSINQSLLTAPIDLEGLLPGTVYHFRFVAESSGGGSVYGIDPDGKGPQVADPLHGLEGAFRTHSAKGPVPSCANAAFRAGPGSELPDCRAYEMVSPLEKGNADVAPWIGRSNQAPQVAEIDQAAPSGGRFTYSSSIAFGDAKAAPFASQYLAERGPVGWSSRALMPPRTEPPVGAESLLTNEFQGFSEDLCAAWIRHYSVAPLASGAIEGYANVYRRDNCAGSPAYTTLSPAKPRSRLAEKYFGVRVQGFSADSAHTVFTANGRLEDTTAPALKGELELLLYEHGPDGLRFVCHQPNGSPIGQACAAGLPAGTSGSQSSTHNAISADGSRIFWTAYTGSLTAGVSPATPGQIFVRIDGSETVRISGSVGFDPASYWTAADDGSKAIFSFASGPSKGELYEFDVEAETPHLIAKAVDGPMGASEDVSHIYFASTEDLDGAGPAEVGDHNLYLYEAEAGGGAGVFTFIMVLAGRDLVGTDPEPAPIDEVPSQRSARVSPDGRYAAFTSAAGPTPTGYDNTDVSTGVAAQEVYLYDATSDELRCVSCNPTGARPVALNIGPVFPIPIAGRIQGWEANNHAPRVISEDGARVFFESYEALEPHDTNGTWDVYQWERAGKGTCTTASDTYSDASGGCVDLLSAGTSRAKSTFLDADPSGDNVFFSTQSSLVSHDYGLNDVYVARVAGGFPEPVVRAPCEGEACQVPPPPPPAVTPPTETSQGLGNVTVKPKPRRCPRGKRKVRRAGKVKCIKRKGKARDRRRRAR